jgi:VPDSG-CTERM motif
MNPTTSKKLIKIFGVVAALLVVTALCPRVGAAEITGKIDFGVGTVTYDTNSLATATQVSTWTNARVTLATGNFATFQITTPGSPGDAVTLAMPWVFNPSTATNPLWSVDGFSFALASSSIVTQNVNFLNISGPGTITGNGFDPTPGVWSFTSTNSNGNPQTQFTFTTDSTAIPDGGTTVALLGLAFAGLEGARRVLRRH